MEPSQAQIDRACRRLARVTRFPSFPGGIYAFTSEDLTTGAWFPAGSEHPLLMLAELSVEVPAEGSDAFELVQARLRIAIEDALAARLASS